MEEAVTDVLLRNCEDFDNHVPTASNDNRNFEEVPQKFDVQEQQQSQRSVLGNEENAPENSIANPISGRQQHSVAKRMRMGGTPYKDRSNRRLSGSDTSSVASSSNRNQLLLDAASDNPIVFSNDMTVLPQMHGNKAGTSDAGTDASSSFSASSHNWLNEFGKQNKGNLGSSSQGRHNIKSIMRSVDKDPRFHSQRPVADRGENALPKQSERPESGAPLEEQQIFLAPVMGPPCPSPWKDPKESFRRSSTATKRSSAVEASHARVMGPPCPSPWKDPKESFRRSSASKRSSAVEASHAAIAAAQEAPGLAESSSQETSSSSSHSHATSTLTASTTSSMASALVKRIVDKEPAHHDSTMARLQRQGVRGTPVRVKPRIRPQEVQATDQGYASVAKLSAWLADDPTSTKKVRHVRRGANVIAKSRRFEKDLEDVVVEENKTSHGTVQEKKDWLKSVFSEDAEDCHNDYHDPTRHMMMMRTQPVNLDDSCARSEFVVANDAASTISVNDKKKWLQNAFKKEGTARSDIGPLRGCNDDITSKAKKMWQQKSEKRQGPFSAQKPPTARPISAASPWRKPPTGVRDLTPRKLMEESNHVPGRAFFGHRSSAPSSFLSKACASAEKAPARRSVATVQVEEDTTPVDFRAAREKLIQRSKENGNDVTVASKVQLRAGKFEKINKQTKRRSSSVGLFKPSWESNCGSFDEGSEASGPRGSYTKTFVPDIAPKRSFDELP